MRQKNALRPAVSLRVDIDSLARGLEETGSLAGGKEAGAAEAVHRGCVRTWKRSQAGRLDAARGPRNPRVAVISTRPRRFISLLFRPWPRFPRRSGRTRRIRDVGSEEAEDGEGPLRHRHHDHIRANFYRSCLPRAVLVSRRSMINFLTSCLAGAQGHSRVHEERQRTRT